MWHANRKGIRADVKAASILDTKASFSDRVGQGITTVLFLRRHGHDRGHGGARGPHRHAEGARPGRGGRSSSFGAAVALAARRTWRADRDGGGSSRRTTRRQPTPYPGTLFGITALARQTLWDAKAYAAEDKPKTDLTYEGLRPLVTGEMPAMFTLTNAREIARAGHLADEFGFKMVVNGVGDAYREIDVLKAHAAPVIVSLDVPDAPSATSTTIPQRVLDDRIAQ